ncbi:MAG: N-acetylmuramoyl-L-alanine amidase [Myxococcota bacterium]
MKGLPTRGLALSVCIAVLSPLPVLSGTVEESYASIRDDYLELRRDPEKQRFRHNHLRILDAFESFVSDHPRHPKAPDALYNAGRLAWDLYLVSRVRADLRRSIELFDRLAEGYPESSLADDAVFLTGRILLEHGGDLTEAYKAFERVVESFPRGDMVDQAKEMLGRLVDHAPTNSDQRVREPEPVRTVARAGAWQGNAGESPATVGAPDVRESGEGIRVSLPVEGQVRYREGEVPADPSRDLPRRLYVDLQPASLAGPPAETAVDRKGVRRVRVGQFSPDVVRVVVDTGAGEPLRVFPLLGVDTLVIDVTGEEAAPDPVEAILATAAGDEGGDASSNVSDEERARRIRERLSEPQEVPLSVQAGLKVRRVVLDAGHGGHDPGAIGPSGLQEKGVVLDIALKVGALLEETGLEVVYTRTEDVFIPLEERTRIANDRSADLFVSIHANASTRRSRRGVSTYYLDVTSDRYSMRLAARENAAAERSVGELQLILADLTTRHNTDESARLARSIQESLVGRLSNRYEGVRNLGVRYALFFVLLGARMPSVLVETSFISNPVEERRFRNEAYLDQVAGGVAQGIVDFIEERDSLALGE